MQYRTYKETMLPQMVRLWKEEAVRIRYKAYDSPEEWKDLTWLSGSLHVTKGNCSMFCRRLERAGHITMVKNDKDARFINVVLKG